MAKAISPLKEQEERTQKKVAEIHETTREATITEEEMSDDEVPVTMLDESSELTPIETNLGSEKETSSEEENKKMTMRRVVQRQQN